MTKKIAFIATDGRWRIEKFNQSAEALFGLTAHDILNRDLRDFFSNRPVCEQLAEANDGQFVHAGLRHANQTVVFAPVCICTKADHDTGPEGYVVTIMLSGDQSDLPRPAGTLPSALDFIGQLTRKVPVALYIYRFNTRGGCFLYCSEPFQQLFHIDPVDLIGQDFRQTPLYGRIVKEDIRRLKKYTIDMIVDGDHRWCSDFRIRRPDGTIRWLRGESHAYKTEDHTIDWYGSFTDITELKRRQEELERQTLVDDPTGGYNRRYYNSNIGAQLALASRSGQPLSLILFDLDHFKMINDRHGHEAGDRVLQAIGALVRQRIRISDVFCRIGGEEFLIICPNTARPGALSLAQDLRQAFAALDLSPLPPVTGSFGVAEWTGQEDGDGLLRRADAASYRAKRAGRNSVQGA